MKGCIVAVGCLIAGIFQAHAFVKLPDILSSGMVLQRETPVPIWGTALPGEAITVRFKGQVHQTEADMAGAWQVLLNPMKADADPSTMEIEGINKVQIQSVVIGEVWLCAGQSNMQLVLSSTDKGDSVIASANYPMIHLFNVDRSTSFGHTKGPLGAWTPCTPGSVRDFSAAAYYYASGLQEELGVPVGIINASFGGSQAEAWTPKSYLTGSDLQPCIDRDTSWARERAAVQLKYAQQLADWRVYAQKQKAAGRRPNEAPHQPEALRDYRPTASIYRNMIAPLIPFQIKGCFWYQGESNEGRAEQYGILLPTMIRAWRDQWKYDFPFGIIQLPNYRRKEAVPTDGAWSFLREAQRRTADSVAGAGLIVLIDAGEAANIHPRNKLVVGQRMLRWALASVYGEAILPGGPKYVSARSEQHAMVVEFADTGSGLTTRDGNPPASFALAGSDRQWHWAEAAIINAHQVRVWSKEVPHPVAVRYSFNNNPDNPNLTNETGVPATPFRSDNWEGPTHGRR